MTGLSFINNIIGCVIDIINIKGIIKTKNNTLVFECFLYQSLDNKVLIWTPNIYKMTLNFDDMGVTMTLKFQSIGKTLLSYFFFVRRITLKHVWMEFNPFPYIDAFCNFSFCHNVFHF